jgi:hypothetical protein
VTTDVGGSSVADPGCLSRIRIFSIPDPNFFHPGSQIRIFSIPDPNFSSRIRIKEFNDFMIRLFIPDPDPDFLPNPDPGVKKAPDPGSATQVPGRQLTYFHLSLGPWEGK